MTNNAGQFVKKLLIYKHDKANDNLIHGNQIIVYILQTDTNHKH